MPEPTYDNVSPLVVDQQATGNYLRVVFQCPVSGEQVTGSASATSTQGDLVKKEIKHSVWRNIRWSISSAVRSMFGYNAGGIIAGAVADVALTPGHVRDYQMTKDEVKAATLEAFRQVANKFAWDQTNARWVSAKTLRELQAELTVLIQQANITKKWDRAVLTRMLAEIAAADGAVADEERELFHAFGDDGMSLDELFERAPLTAADMEECSDDVRHEMWLLSAAMAVTDKELADTEKALLSEWGASLGIAPKDQARGLELAREWVVDQALDASYADGKLDKSENAEIRAIAKALGVPNERVDRLDARTRKRRGIY